jgi:hypothetical protein
MNIMRIASIGFLTLTIFAAPVLSLSAQAQDPQPQNQAMMRGYRTGYSDGYQAGVNDAANSAERNFKNKAEYDRADRAYNNSYGAVEEYRDGYRQGFEAGYVAGFDRKPFDSTIPDDLKRRTEDSTVQNPIDQNKTPVLQPAAPAQPVAPNAIPRDTIIRVELMNNIATDVSQQGDRFQAKIIEPKELEGSIVEGHIALIKRPGKAKGTAELQLAFERIKFVDGRSATFSAQVIEVIPYNGDNVGKVDSEGGVKGSDSTGSDVKKVGIFTGIGAAIGAIAGGGSGAAIGAGVGAGAGTAGVLTQRGKDIRLSQGQQLRLRTNAEVAAQ